jgi:hypothetical protein
MVFKKILGQDLKKINQKIKNGKSKTFHQMGWRKNSTHITTRSIASS